jgi:hypothetical protein
MLVDPDKMQGDKTYCRQTGRLFWIQETDLVYEYEETGELIGNRTTFDGASRQCTHIIWYFMLGRYPEQGKEIDHWDGNVVNSRWNNLRECTASENSRNVDRRGRRWNGLDEDLESCVSKRAARSYEATKGGVYYGRFKTAEEANAVAREIRAEFNGEFDVSRRPEWDYDPNDLATVIDTDRAVKGRWYCPRVGRLFVCKHYALRDNGLEYGVETSHGKYQVRIERKAYGRFASAAEASAVAHKIYDELWGDNGRVTFDPDELQQRVNVFVGRQVRALDDLAPIGRYLVGTMGIGPYEAGDMLMAAFHEHRMFAGLGGYSRCSTAVWAAVGRPLPEGGWSRRRR